MELTLVSTTMNSYKRALTIATDVHRHQIDLSGKPYITHPLYVADHVTGNKTKIVALLHDVIEDGGITIDYLKKFFTDDVCDAVNILTRKKGVPYLDYIKLVKGNKLAKTVKIADLEHNMQVNRLDRLTMKDIARLKKYIIAYKELTSE